MSTNDRIIQSNVVPPYINVHWRTPITTPALLERIFLFLFTSQNDSYPAVSSARSDMWSVLNKFSDCIFPWRSFRQDMYRLQKSLQRSSTFSSSSKWIRSTEILFNRPSIRWVVSDIGGQTVLDSFCPSFRFPCPPISDLF